jgi:hypothetical protein
VINLSLNREKPGASLKKLSNGDKVGVKIIKDKVVLAAEVLFVSELGDYNGVTVRMTPAEARQLIAQLNEALEKVESAPPAPPTPSEN